jgi:hypothetical protein
LHRTIPEICDAPEAWARRSMLRHVSFHHRPMCLPVAHWNGLRMAFLFPPLDELYISGGPSEYLSTTVPDPLRGVASDSCSEEATGNGAAATALSDGTLANDALLWRKRMRPRSGIARLEIPPVRRYPLRNCVLHLLIQAPTSRAPSRRRGAAVQRSEEIVGPSSMNSIWGVFDE